VTNKAQSAGIKPQEQLKGRTEEEKVIELIQTKNNEAAKDKKLKELMLKIKELTTTCERERAA
jgi:hypothetical protein